MSRLWKSRGYVRGSWDVDIERQGSKNDGTGSEKRAIGQVNHPLTKTIISKTPWWFHEYFHWDVAFLVVCVVAVAVDPLVFYLPVIKVRKDTKCIDVDKDLEIVAICVRSFLDLIALGDLVARIIKYRKSPHKIKISTSDYVINILSILPVPQIVVPIIFSEMRDYNSRYERRFLIVVVTLQYVPRIFRIYRLWKIVLRRPKSNPRTTTSVEVNVERCFKGFILMKAGFNLFLYLVAGHVLGAFWYFFSFEREITCWQLACGRNDTGCSTIPFRCDGGIDNNILNNFCPIEIVEKSNTSLVDFGIFQEARESGSLRESTNFPQKSMFCFWWALRNLSSLGQNLNTSPFYWENCFAVLISISGLFLLLYCIGNIQTYIQWETSNELDEIKSNLLKNKMQEKLHTIEDWISKMGQLPDDLKNMIMDNVTRILEDQNNAFDTENPFPYLSEEIRRRIKINLCLPLLRRVPIFENESEEFLSKITCTKHLKHVHYNQNNLIVREGKSLNKIIFVLKGTVCSCTSNHDNKTVCPEKCDLIGESLVEWVLESPKQSNPPLSTRNFKCLTEVEAFCLTARDLKDIISQNWWKFSELRNNTQFDSKQLNHFAATSIQRVWRRHNHSIHPKQERTSKKI
ncbi:hypothetical protein I3760_06G008300 [Carya illinoinensis]|nr:hypothetical protein I3760_06G008300 [Carya illinoinensis]